MFVAWYIHHVARPMQPPNEDQLLETLGWAAQIHHIDRPNRHVRNGVYGRQYRKDKALILMTAWLPQKRKNICFNFTPKLPITPIRTFKLSQG